MPLTGDVPLRREAQIQIQDYQVAAGAVIYSGAIVATTEANGGFLVPASDAAGVRVVGVADETADNTGGADGAIEAPVYTGNARIASPGGSAIVQNDVGGMAFVVDDGEVAKAAGTGNSILAGSVIRVEPGFAWVRFR